MMLQSRRTVCSLLSLLLLLLSFNTNNSIFVSADDFISNDFSNDVATTAGKPYRVSIPPFTLTLSPTFGGTLSKHQEDVLEDASTVVLKEYLQAVVPNTIIAVDYVALLNVVQDTVRSMQDAAVIEIGGGLASFRAPSSEQQLTVPQVNEWVSQAFGGSPLLQTLQEETELNFVETVMFASLTPAPSMAPIAPSKAPSKAPLSFGGIEEGTNSQSNGTNSSIVGAIAGVGILAAALLLLHRKRKRSGMSQEEPVTPSIVSSKSAVIIIQDDDSFTPPPRPILESESEWTDASTVNDFPRSSILQTESFERDRQVYSLKKDMMETPWSTANVVQQQPFRNTTTSSTVLKPSHFSASYDADEYWNPDDATANTNDESPFLFQKAQGEEVILMPPSRTRTSRGNELV